MNADDHGQSGGKSDSESNKEEKMSIDDQQESRRSEDDVRETKRQRLASVATSQPKPELKIERFWDHVNGGELDAHEVRKARQLEVDYLNKMRVFERVPCEVAKARMRRENPSKCDGWTH